MRPPARIAAVVALGLVLLITTGCGSAPLVGIIYTHVRLPLTANLDKTPFPATAPVSGKVIQLKEPFSGYGIYARVNSNAIGDIARKHGVDTVYFADQEIFSLLGIWKTTQVHVYGR